MAPEYIMASTPHNFALRQSFRRSINPDEMNALPLDAETNLLEEVLIPLAEQLRLPIVLKVRIDGTYIHDPYISLWYFSWTLWYDIDLKSASCAIYTHRLVLIEESILHWALEEMASSSSICLSSKHCAYVILPLNSWLPAYRSPINIKRLLLHRSSLISTCMGVGGIVITPPSLIGSPEWG